MTPAMNPAAPHHVPAFFTAPGETDVLFYAMVIFLVLLIILVGNLYFRLHALPERLAHKGQKIQFELVAVLALISLFTHNHLFWVAGLILALIPLPDFWTPLAGMDKSLAKMSGRSSDLPEEMLATATSEEAAERPSPPEPAIAAAGRTDADGSVHSSPAQAAETNGGEVPAIETGSPAPPASAPAKPQRALSKQGA